MPQVTEAIKISRLYRPGRSKRDYTNIIINHEWMQAIGLPDGTQYRVRLDEENKRIVIEPVK